MDFEDAANISPTVADAVAYALQEEFWSSFGLPGGRRDALVNHAIDDGSGAYIPVLVDRSLRVLLGIETRDSGYTASGSLHCV